MSTILFDGDVQLRNISWRMLANGVSDQDKWGVGSNLVYLAGNIDFHIVETTIGGVITALRVDIIDQAPCLEFLITFETSI